MTMVEREFAECGRLSGNLLDGWMFLTFFFSEKTCGAYGSKRRTMSWPCGEMKILSFCVGKRSCDARVHLWSGAWRQLLGL